MQDLLLLIKCIAHNYRFRDKASRDKIFYFQSTEKSLQSQLYTIAIVFGVLYFLLILLFVALAFYIWR